VYKITEQMLLMNTAAYLHTGS